MINYLTKAGLIIRTEKKDGSQYGFSKLDGMFRGHIDGLIVGTKDDIDVGFNTPAIWENKVLNHTSFTHLKNHGTEKNPSHYITLNCRFTFTLWMKRKILHCLPT